jgi:putative restriction endonuclease
MAKAILNCGPNSIYDDELRHRKEVSRCLKDDVIFYEPMLSGGRKAYMAAARVVAICADNAKGPGNYYAILEGFKYFDKIVPHIVEGSYLESNGLTSRGQFTGRKSVRFPKDEEFKRILQLGGC